MCVSPMRFLWLLLCLPPVLAVECPAQEAILPCRCLVRGDEFQIWCSHSELPRVLDGLKSVAQQIRRPIDELILENNNLPALPGRVFSPLKVLRLMLRNNALERVSNDWLSGLESSLLELFVVEPILRSFPEDSLDQMSSLEAVTVQTELLKRLPRFSRLPRLKHLQIESASLIELQPRYFRSLPALEKFHVAGSPRLTRLDSGLLQDLPRLATVNVSHCGLTIVHARAFTRLPALKELILTGNKITDAGMVGRASHDLPALELLKLDWNSLDRLAEASFVDLVSLKNLHLSNNRILEIHHGAFHRVPALRTVDLNHNLIRRIHSDSFLQHSGSGIEELWMVDNDIGHIADLRSLLDALPRLVFLDMSHNHLQEVPFGALRGHATLERLHLDHNRIRIVEREAFTAMPALRELRLRNNSLSNLLDVPLWNLPSLKGLDLAQNYFRRLEPRLLTNLPSLRRVDLSENQIIVVDPVSFLDVPALEHVNLSYNALTSLHPATFRHIMNLYELDVSYNKLIEFVPGLPRAVEHLFVTGNQLISLPFPPSLDLDLPALRMLDVSSNLIQRVPPDSLRTLPQLRRFYLNKNYLEHLEDGSMEGLARLEVLNLSENKLMIVHPNTLQDMSELRELNLNNNHLESIRPELFRNLKNLKKLDMSSNFLSHLMNGTLVNTRNLQIIDASDNRLTDLPITFKDLKHLRVLDLTNNRMQDLKSDIFTSLTSLTELKLSRNLVRELRRGAFENLRFLKDLHLDSNELEVMDSNALHDLPALSAVKLNRNRLKLIPDGAFNKLPSLETAELQENKLVSMGNNAFFQVPHLLFLNLSGNHLTGIEEAGLRSVSSLEVLDLSFNRISRIMASNLEKMEWLVELKLDDNEICAVHGAPFGGMPRLRVLSMRNNKMMALPETAVETLRGNIAVLDIDGNPLMCSCNMVWMRAWLQEAGSVGPRCSDGSLLREMRLSRRDCSFEHRIADPVAPGCEAELLSVPSYSTSQVFSQWMDLKEQTTSANQQNANLAPSPEESEYFYDEYVDYPYNETVPDNNNSVSNNINTKILKAETTTSKVSSHYISGDTPTLYAATNKNKSAEAPMKTASPSPSSSGFTFFGVPLPALSLNNLWPGKGKAADRKTDARGLSGRGNYYPPSEPQVQTGGFRPILLGNGGFVPMTPPPLQSTTWSAERVRPRTTTAPEPTIHHKSDAVHSSAKNVTIFENNSITDIPQHETKLVENTQRTNILHEETTVADKLTTVTASPDVTKSTALLETASGDDFEDLFDEIVDNVSVPTTTETSHKIETTVPSTVPSNGTSSTNKDNSTTLSALLVPGGQQPSYRPPFGRSTITKVVSPHVPELITTEISADESTTVRNIHKKEIETIATTKVPRRDASMSWYFVNYNRSNLQPYVDPAIYDFMQNRQTKLSSSLAVLLVFCKGGTAFF